MPSTVAIVGRPNVGKSTLFNRLTGRRRALVDDAPGVTRDRREGDARLGGLAFTLIDTAGLEDAARGSLQQRMSVQSQEAIRQADVALFLIDARVGVTPADQQLAHFVRKTGSSVIVVANKAEGGQGRSGAAEGFSLGLGDPVPVSAEHGEGLDELHDRLERALPGAQPDTRSRRARGRDVDDDDDADDNEARALRLAIVGRPNAGKSTLVNRLLGSDRMLTGPEAGITRDAISIDWDWKDNPVTLWDTAGIRKRARVTEKLEKLSVADGLRAVRFAEVVVLVLDATIALEKQDLTLADQVSKEGRALVIAINKWDLIKDRGLARRNLKAQVDRLLPQLSGVPVVTMSAATGNGVGALMPAVMKVYETWNFRVPTAKLNEWLQFQTSRHPPPAPSGRRIKLRYMTQARARPPTFALFCSNAADLTEAYKRYLINGLRKDFKLWGVPVRINLRRGKNPYAKAP